MLPRPAVSSWPVNFVPALALAALVAAPAAHAAQKPLEISRAWSRPAVAGTNGVGYLTIANHTGRADAVTAIATPAAGHVEMHAMSMAGGVMSMNRVDKVALPAGGRAEFAPNGYHLMLVGLTHTLAVGDAVPVTVTFASGAKQKAKLTVALAPPTS
jgi:copper(I)-binding protein